MSPPPPTLEIYKLVKSNLRFSDKPSLFRTYFLDLSSLPGEGSMRFIPNHHHIIGCTTRFDVARLRVRSHRGCPAGRQGPRPRAAAWLRRRDEPIRNALYNWSTSGAAELVITAASSSRNTVVRGKNCVQTTRASSCEGRSLRDQAILLLKRPRQPHTVSLLSTFLDQIFQEHSNSLAFIL